MLFLVLKDLSWSNAIYIISSLLQAFVTRGNICEVTTQCEKKRKKNPEINIPSKQSVICRRTCMSCYNFPSSVNYDRVMMTLLSRTCLYWYAKYDPLNNTVKVINLILKGLPPDLEIIMSLCTEKVNKRNVIRLIQYSTS